MSDRQLDPDEADEAADDTIIGIVFYRSLVAIGLFAIFVTALLWLFRPPPPQSEVAREKDTSQIRSLPANEGVVPEMRFTDITQDSGIDFQHTNGAAGEKLLPETMGGGVAFVDFDGDGKQDLFFVNARNWPESDRTTASSCQLYRNLGECRFKDVTEHAGLTTSLYGMGCAVGDYDNDGDPDIFVTALGVNRLYRNDDGTFQDVTERSGLGDQKKWSTSAGFFDYDADGDLDLFVCNYVEWDREIDFAQNFTLNGQDRAYGPPTGYRGVFPNLYRNNGDGVFEDVTESAGLCIESESTNLPLAKSLGVVFADLDSDGWTDLIVANDTVQNQLFHNQGNGTFTEIGTEAGVGFDRDGQATGAMGIDIGYPFGEARAAVGVANFANEPTSLFVAQDQPLAFVDQSLAEGVGGPSRIRLTFGLAFVDVDLDGRQEFLQVNGHLEEAINEVQPSQTYLQAPQLFYNCGPDARRCFAVVPDEKVGDLSQPMAARGLAYADIDQDGDLDLVVTQVGRRAVLFRNDIQSRNHWLRLRLVGTTSNRDALGSYVEAVVGNHRMTRTVSATRSYLSQTETIVTFGLGERNSVDALTVIWPSGRKTELEQVPGDQLLVIHEPR